MRQGDVEDRLMPGTAAAENAELREAKKRIRLLEQENEVLAPRGCISVTGPPQSNERCNWRSWLGVLRRHAMIRASGWRLTRPSPGPSVPII